MNFSNSFQRPLEKLIHRLTLWYYRHRLNTMAIFSPKRAAESAGRIFRVPRRVRLLPEEKEFLQKNFRENIEVNGEKIAVYHWPGSGSAILLAHGWESCTARWNPYIADLMEIGMDIYAIDAPAHGLSEGIEFSPERYADALETVSRRFDIQTILAHSVGAYSSIVMASRPDSPSRIERLILLAPTGKIKAFMERFFDTLQLRQEIRRQYFDSFKEAFQRELEEYDADRLIRQVHVPGLLIHDTQDLSLPYRDSEEIAKNWENCEFHITRGYGHRLKSTEVSDLIMAYLSRNLPRATQA